jgi:hypothetical protein
MKTTTILTLLITITSTAACDSAVIGECVITPVGVQGITEDRDMTARQITRRSWSPR